MPSQKCLGQMRPSFHPLNAEAHKEPEARSREPLGSSPRPSGSTRPEADFHFARLHEQLPPPIRGRLAATGKEAAPVPGLHKAQDQAAAGCLACDRGGAARGAGRGERGAEGAGGGGWSAASPAAGGCKRRPGSPPRPARLRPARPRRRPSPRHGLLRVLSVSRLPQRRHLLPTRAKPHAHSEAAKPRRSLSPAVATPARG